MFSSGSQRVLTEGQRGPVQEPCALRAVPGLTGRRVALPRGQPGDAPSPSRRQTPSPSGSWNLPDTARRCFQHLRRGAEPLLHSRKIFVQGLGTAEEEINATLEPGGRCFVCACGAPRLRPAWESRPTPRLPLPALLSFGSGLDCQLGQQTFTEPTLRQAQSWALDAAGESGPWPRLRGCCEGGWLTSGKAVNSVQEHWPGGRGASQAGQDGQHLAWG